MGEEEGSVGKAGRIFAKTSAESEHKYFFFQSNPKPNFGFLKYISRSRIRIFLKFLKHSEPNHQPNPNPNLIFRDFDRNLRPDFYPCRPISVRFGVTSDRIIFSDRIFGYLNDDFVQYVVLSLALKDDINKIFSSFKYEKACKILCC